MHTRLTSPRAPVSALAVTALSAALSAALLAALLAAPSAHAATETWAAGSGSAKGASGSVTLSFSSLEVAFLNTTQGKVIAGPSSTATSTTTVSATGVPRYTSLSVSAPVATLTGEVSGNTMAVSRLTSDWGLTLTSPKNGASTGPGSLSLSNLTLDFGAKTVYADVLGANGVGSLSQYAIWTFSGLQGGSPVVLPSVSPTEAYAGSFATLGVFAPTASFTDVFVRALALNTTGRSMLSSVNDPTKGNGGGFGSFSGSLTRVFAGEADGPSVLPDTTPSGSTSPVPEPGGLALVLAGLACATVVARRARR